MKRRTRNCPEAKGIRITETTDRLLDRMAQCLDLPRGKIVDMAVRLLAETPSQEIPSTRGDSRHSPAEFRLSPQAVSALQQFDAPFKDVVECAVAELYSFLASHDEIPLRILTVRRVWKSPTAGKA